MQFRDALKQPLRSTVASLAYAVRQEAIAWRHWLARIRGEEWYYLGWTCRKEFFSRAFHALSFNGIDGDYVEFGYGLRTFGLALQQSRAANKKCKLWAFDSFQGLPEARCSEDSHPRWIPGTMQSELSGAYKYAEWLGLITPTDYELVPGYFKESLVRSSEPTNICLAYIDCDLFSSTLDVLTFLLPRFKQGMILGFDDYFCDSQSAPSGEREACRRFFKDNPGWRLVPYFQIGWYGMSFVVERSDRA